MIKQLLTLFLVLVGLAGKSQATFTITYDFAATTTVSGTTDPTTPPSVTGLTCGSFVAVGTPSASPNAAGRFSFVGWPVGSPTATATYTDMTGAINTAEYYEVNLTPQTGYTLTLNSIGFTVQRSGTGVRSYAVRTSVDGFTNNLPASVGASTVLSVQGVNEFFYNIDGVTTAQNGSLINLFGATTDQPVAFRFYGWNSEAGTGTFSIDNVTFDGSMSIATKVGNLNFDLNSNFNVYPVPSQDGILFIENKNAMELTKIEVLDVLGNVVVTNNTKNDSRVKLNLSEMPNGNYFVRMYSGNSVSTRKISIIK